MNSLIPRTADQNSSISTSVRTFSWLQIAKQIRRDKPTVGSANPGWVSLDCIGKIAECEPSSKLGSSIPSWVPLQVSAFNSCLGVPRWRTGTSKQAHSSPQLLLAQVSIAAAEGKQTGIFRSHCSASPMGCTPWGPWHRTHQEVVQSFLLRI